MQTQRAQLKEDFIRNKQTVRTLIALLAARDALSASAFTHQLKELQVRSLLRVH